MAHGSTKAIDVSGLEKELSAMWAEMSAQQREGVHRSITRACVLNLVVFITPQDDRAELDEVLDEVTEQHPCRALVLLADGGASVERLDAYVSMRCKMFQRGGKQICGEQVTIEAAGASVERVASVVAPLFVPDVPVFLWWKDIPHTDDKLFERLSEMADRIVIDSAFSDRPHLDFLRLSRMLADTRRPVRASDVNWGRLTSWRTLLASFWDVEAYRAHLERIVHVRIDFVPPAVAPEDVASQAWLLAGWLASRLKWEVDAAGGRREEKSARLRLRDGSGRVVEIEMRAVDSEPGCRGNVAALTLSAEDERAQFHVEYRHERTKLETSAKVGGEHRVGRVLAYEARSEGRRLSSELTFLSRDKIYEQAVSAAAQMIESLMGVENGS